MEPPTFDEQTNALVTRTSQNRLSCSSAPRTCFRLEERNFPMTDFNPKRAFTSYPHLLNLLMGGLLVIVILLISPVRARAATSPAVRVPALSWRDCGDGFQCATAAV